MDVSIRHAEPRDAARLADLAAKTFRDTFAGVIPADDLDAHLGWTYGEPIQAAEIADAGMRTLVAESAYGLAGYAQLRKAEAPPEVDPGGAVELRRFYLDLPWIGRGLADRLMAEVLAAAFGLGEGAVWLHAYAGNPRAIAFYRRSGFDPIGTSVPRIGKVDMPHLLMAKKRVAG